MSIWPTPQEPNNFYKIGSAYVTLKMDQNVTERQTYSFLEWLGDIGGLNDALRIIGALIIGSYSTFMLKVELLTNVFRYTDSKRYAESRTKSMYTQTHDDFEGGPKRRRSTPGFE